MHLFQQESPKKLQLQTTEFYNRIEYFIGWKNLQRQNKLKGP